MMYPYMKLADETEIVHSQIIEENGKKKVIVNFERPNENGLILLVVSCQIINGWSGKAIRMKK